MQSNLDMAKRLIQRRKFNTAIKILESSRETYDGDFEYHLTLGIAYLYAGIGGQASLQFRKARNIKMQDPRLLLGQAIIFLRNGDTDRAVSYYLEVLDCDPENSTAKDALEFIRNYSGSDLYHIMCKYADSGEIRRFYPPVGMNPDIIRNCVFAGLAIGALCSVLMVADPAAKIRAQKKVAEVDQRFYLTEDELKNSVQLNAAEGEFVFNLSSRDVQNSFNLAKKYLAAERDNAVQVEVNKILNSNAADFVKDKAKKIQSLLKEPTFDSLKDNYSYEEILENPVLYENCFVIWDGSAAKIIRSEDGNSSCTFFVNYLPDEKKFDVSGTVQVVFDRDHQVNISEGKAVRILSKIVIDDKKIYLSGRGIFQQLKGNSLSDS